MDELILTQCIKKLKTPGAKLNRKPAEPRCGHGHFHGEQRWRTKLLNVDSTPHSSVISLREFTKDAHSCVSARLWPGVTPTAYMIKPNREEEGLFPEPQLHCTEAQLHKIHV